MQDISQADNLIKINFNYDWSYLHNETKEEKIYFKIEHKENIKIDSFFKYVALLTLLDAHIVWLTNNVACSHNICITLESNPSKKVGCWKIKCSGD